MKWVTRFLGAATIALSSAAAAQAPKVVFVCEHGTVKSLVALEYFNKLARERGLAVRAVSRGTHPDSLVPMIVRRGLALDGFDVAMFQPRRFTREDVSSAILVVALDADVDSVVAGKNPVVRWNGLPSVMADYSGARTAIVARVERLVDSLAGPRSKPEVR